MQTTKSISELFSLVRRYRRALMAIDRARDANPNRLREMAYVAIHGEPRKSSPQRMSRKMRAALKIIKRGSLILSDEDFAIVKAAME